MTPEDIAWIDALQDNQRKWDGVYAAAKRKGRPPLIIEGPGFIMIRKPSEPPRRTIPEHIMLGMLGSLLVSVATLAFLYFAAPSILSHL